MPRLLVGREGAACRAPTPLHRIKRSARSEAEKESTRPALAPTSPRGRGGRAGSAMRASEGVLLHAERAGEPEGRVPNRPAKRGGKGEAALRARRPRAET